MQLADLAKDWHDQSHLTIPAPERHVGIEEYAHVWAQRHATAR